MQHKYCKLFTTVEVNNTYYRWPRDEVFTSWRERTHSHFLLIIKASGGLTHRTKLRNPEASLAKLSSGLQTLRNKLGVFLAQLPPWWKTAIEFRHKSWHREDVFQLLEQYNVAY